jgi:preprotein translocase SecE subunit
MAQIAREQSEPNGATNSVTDFFQRLADYPRRMNKFFHEVRVEMKLVNWPSWEDVKSTTTVVIVTVAFFAVYFLFTDTIFSRLEGVVWRHFKH